MKLPQGFLGTLGAVFVVVEHQRHLAVAQLLGPGGDLLQLFVRHAVGHDADGGLRKCVEPDHVVHALDDENAGAGDRFSMRMKDRENEGHTLPLTKWRE